MKIRALFIVFAAIAAFQPVFAEDLPGDIFDEKEKITQTQSQTENPGHVKGNTADVADETGFLPGKANRGKKHADISPMKEHIKTKTAVQASLNKNKKQFQKRIENELFLLRGQ